MISKEEVLKIAKLARLELTEAEVGKMQKDMSAILDYFDLLKKAPKSKKVVSGIAESHLRKDEAREDARAGDLVLQAPEQKDGYIKVKNIF